jgi:hypothetical protein
MKKSKLYESEEESEEEEEEPTPKKTLKSSLAKKKAAPAKKKTPEKEEKKTLKKEAKPKSILKPRGVENELIFRTQQMEVRLTFNVTAKRKEAIKRFLKDIKKKSEAPKSMREAAAKNKFLSLRMSDDNDELVLEYSKELQRFAVDIDNIGIYFSGKQTENIMEWLRELAE